ncbi:MAG: Maf family protein [Coriobacteriia bacterium]|nr:Maf family protein [Coriobacteriia bacterium]
MELVLASASPRRREILEAHGIACQVLAPVVDEEALVAAWERTDGKDVGALVTSLALAKAREAQKQVESIVGRFEREQHEALEELEIFMPPMGLDRSRPSFAAREMPTEFARQQKMSFRYILAADTLVYNGHILGKPYSPERAIAMLMELSGCSHEVYTGVAFLDRLKSTKTLLFDVSTVTFQNYDEEAARAYVVTGEPLDKAGAYAIQGLWGMQVASIEGDFENIVGLPWHKIEPLLVAQQGV